MSQPNDPILDRPLDRASSVDAQLTWPPDLATEPPARGRIGNYELLEQIGVGGMGVVYRGQQLAPVRRTVAIKLMKLGTQSPAALARFEAERQVLAQLEHPGIARVYDAGVTDLGRPYVVMEYVAGVPITEFCDTRRHTTEQRLRLFQGVCDAVQHAHFKGILHRDLKPSNLLVAEIDGIAQVKVIDFGVAKMIAAPDDLPLATWVGQFVGTPAYSSPEQAAGGDPDTRADVYSLGVVLYELLTGLLPLEETAYTTGDALQIARRIAESEPPKPSTRLGAAGPGDETTAARRATVPELLRRRLRGDLDRIVLKAIARDRDERYGTPLALSEDIRRHLADEPILARPPTLAYQARKFARRNRVLVTASALVALAVVGGGMAASVGLWQARRALAREGEALKQEQAARQAAQGVGDFLSGMLASVDPREAQGRPVLVRDVLDKAAGELPTRFANQPLVAAALHHTISQTYHGLGLFEPSLRHARLSLDLSRQASGRTHPQTLDAAEQVGKVLRANRQFDEAEVVLRELVARRREIDGPDALVTCDAEEALGLVLINLDRAAEAHPLIERSARMNRQVRGPHDQQTLAAMHNLGSAEAALGNLPAAEAIYREVVEARQRLLGPDHPWTLLTMNNLASLLLRQRRAADAEPLFREILARTERVNGPDHEATIDTLNALATAVRLQERMPEAETLFRDVLQRSRRSMPRGHASLARAVASLGLILEQQGRHAEALPLFEEVVAMLPGSGVAPRYAAQYTRSLALTLVRLDRLAEAEAPLRDALSRMQQANIAGGAGYRETLLALARVCDTVGKAEEASRLRAEAATWAPATRRSPAATRP